MDNEMDQKKFDEMWVRILKYEKAEGSDKSKATSVQKIVNIIDEVYHQCY